MDFLKVKLFAKIVFLSKKNIFFSLNLVFFKLGSSYLFFVGTMSQTRFNSISSNPTFVLPDVGHPTKHLYFLEYILLTFFYLRYLHGSKTKFYLTYILPNLFANVRPLNIDFEGYTPADNIDNFIGNVTWTHFWDSKAFQKWFCDCDRWLENYPRFGVDDGSKISEIVPWAKIQSRYWRIGNAWWNQ